MNNNLGTTILELEQLLLRAKETEGVDLTPQNKLKMYAFTSYFSQWLGQLYQNYPSKLIIEQFLPTIRKINQIRANYPALSAKDVKGVQLEGNK